MSDRPGIEAVRTAVRRGLARHAGTRTEDGGPTLPAMAASLASVDLPLATLVADFGLKPWETFLLALAGEVEGNAATAAEVARQDPAGEGWPTLAFAGGLVRDLFGVDAPPLALLSHRLVGAGILAVERQGRPVPLARLSTPPALWSILAGGSAVWPGVEPLADEDRQLLPASLADLVPALAAQLADGSLEALVLRGSAEAGRIFALEIADETGMMAVEASAQAWARADALRASCRYGRWLPVVRLTLGPGESHAPPHGPVRHPAVYLLGRDGGVAGATIAEIDLVPPTRHERARLFGAFSDAPGAAALGRHAALDGPAIRALSRKAALAARRSGEEVAVHHLVAARRTVAAGSLSRLARPVTRQVSREAIVLTARVAARFDDLLARCEEREALWDGLGPAAGEPTLGVHALFAGPSGTGKTLAVSHLATRLGAPLWRIDLSAVLNKYIGETEKNLSAALDEAAERDVVLMMDEADAIFGRRTDGDGEGERFGNMLTNFLLSRIETHPGIVVLTSNALTRIDPAFTRRLSAIIEFPEPGYEERLAIWRGHLGARSPGEAALRLLASRCDLAGGTIRTAVLAAAARAPVSGKGAPPPIPADLLARAAVAEYEKLGRTVPADLSEMAAR